MSKVLVLSSSSLLYSTRRTHNTRPWQFSFAFSKADENIIRSSSLKYFTRSDDKVDEFQHVYAIFRKVISSERAFLHDKRRWIGEYAWMKQDISFSEIILINANIFEIYFYVSTEKLDGNFENKIVIKCFFYYIYACFIKRYYKRNKCKRQYI